MVTLIGGFWLAGRVVWSRNRLLERLVEQSEELRLSREAEARARAAEHRARIGRDVHDVVAHSVSLMVVQAEAGEAQLPADDTLRRSASGRSSGWAGRRWASSAPSSGPSPRTGRQAPRTDRPTRPALGCVTRTALGDLAEAGLHVDLQIDSRRSRCPKGVELAAYRILQEALTNALRHAPDAT